MEGKSIDYEMIRTNGASGVTKEEKALEATGEKEIITKENGLEGTAEKGVLSEFYRLTIIYLCNFVAENLARHYKNVVEGVQSVMGGHVIETDAKKILNDGIRKGKCEERVNTERERHRAEAAEQRAAVAEQKANAAEQRISILQKELEALGQQLTELTRAQSPKLAEQ